MAQRKRKTNRPSTASVTTGSPIRLQSPKSVRKPKPSVTKKVVKEAHPVGGFANFLREYTVVSLAIGFVVATQVQGLVKLLVAGFVDPFTKLMFGHALSNRTFTLHWHTRAANFNWGGFVYGLIDFLIVLVVIYVIIKIFQLDKLNKSKDKR
jgi:large-conductance mechanosensitive channel